MAKNPQKKDPDTGWDIDAAADNRLVDPTTDERVTKAEAMNRIESRKAEEAAKAAAEQQAQQQPQAPQPTAEALQPQARKANPTMAELSREEETVTMIFPRKVVLTLNDHSRVEFNIANQPGSPDEVPVSLADHPYLAQCGVKRYAKK